MTPGKQVASTREEASNSQGWLWGLGGGPGLWPWLAELLWSTFFPPISVSLWPCATPGRGASGMAYEQQVLTRVEGQYVQPAEAEQFECRFGAELAV